MAGSPRLRKFTLFSRFLNLDANNLRVQQFAQQKFRYQNAYRFYCNKPHSLCRDAWWLFTRSDLKDGHRTIPTPFSDIDLRLHRLCVVRVVNRLTTAVHYEMRRRVESFRPDHTPGNVYFSPVRCTIAQFRPQPPPMCGFASDWNFSEEQWRQGDIVSWLCYDVFE